jgi:hypothetical protein
MIALFSPVELTQADSGIEFQVFGDSVWTTYSIAAGRYETLPDLIAALHAVMSPDGYFVSLEPVSALAGLSVRLSHALHVRLRVAAGSQLGAALGFDEGERQPYLMQWASDTAPPSGLCNPTLAASLASAKRYTLACATTLGGKALNRVSGSGLVRKLELNSLDLKQQQVLSDLWLNLARRVCPLYLSCEDWRNLSAPHFMRMMKTYPDWRESGALAMTRSYAEPHPAHADVVLSLVEAT